MKRIAIFLLIFLALPYSVEAAPARASWYTSGTVSADSTVTADSILLMDTLRHMRVIAGFGGNGVKWMANNYPTVINTRYLGKAWFQATASSGGYADTWYYKCASNQFYPWDMMLTLAEPDTQFYAVSSGEIDDWRFDGFGRMAHGGREKVLFEGVVVANDGNTDYTEVAYGDTATITIAADDTIYFRDLGPWHAMKCSVSTAGVQNAGTFTVQYVDTSATPVWVNVATATRDSLVLMFTNTGNTERTMNPPPPLTGANAWGYMNDTAMAIRCIFSGWDSYPVIKGAHRFEYGNRYDAKKGLVDSVAFLGWEPLSDTTGDGWRDTGSYAMCEYYATPTSATSNGRRFSGYFSLSADDSAGALSARDTLGHKILASMLGDYIDDESLPYDGVTFDQPPVQTIFDDAGSDLIGSRALGYEGLSSDSLQTIVWADNVQTSLEWIKDTIDARTSARSDSSWINLTVSEVFGSSTKFICYSALDWWRWGLRGRDYKNCAFAAADSTKRKANADMLFIETWMKAFSVDDYFASGGAGLRALDYVWEYICADQRVLVMYEYTSVTATVGTKMGFAHTDTTVLTARTFYWDTTLSIGDTIIFGSNAGGTDWGTVDTIGPGDGSARYTTDNSASCFCSVVAREGMNHFSAAAYWLIRPGSAFDSAYDDRLHFMRYAGVTGGRPECNASGGDSRAGGWTAMLGPDFDIGEPLNGVDFNDSTYAVLTAMNPYSTWDADSGIYSRQFIKGTDTNLVLFRVTEPGEAFRYDSTGIDSFALGGTYRRVVEDNINGGLDTGAALTYTKLFNNDGGFYIAATAAATGTSTPYDGIIDGATIGMKDEKTSTIRDWDLDRPYIGGVPGHQHHTR